MTLLTVAERAFAEAKQAEGGDDRRLLERPKAWADQVIVVDAETTTDATQRFLFGSYVRAIRVNGAYAPTTRGLIYADDLPKARPNGPPSANSRPSSPGGSTAY